MIILPLVAFVLVALWLRRRFERVGWRDAFTITAVALGVLTTLATECLSLFRAISAPAIIGYWLVVCAGAAAALALSPKRSPASPVMRLQAASTRSGQAGGLLVSMLLSGIAVYVVGTAVIALLAPPNTWDVLEYHLPKVMHWIQNGSVSFYPTAIPRQNHLAPGAEFWVLHLQLLSGSDRFANLVAWFSMLGGLVTVSLIARQLGANVLAQCFASVFAATLPMGILQASSSMTDIVVAFWFVCFVYFFLRLLQSESLCWTWVLALSAALGLAAFTKATAYLLAPAFLVWLAYSTIRRFRARAVGAFAVITVVFLAVNFGHYARNWKLYQHPLGPREEPSENSNYGIESHTPPALASSLAKHVGTHINTPWKKLNSAIQRGFVSFHETIGWKLNDPRTSFGPAWVKFKIAPTDFQDETAGNPLHFILAVVCASLVFVVPSLRRDKALLGYTLCVTAAFLLFAFYLKWHPWMSRLHHGLFVAAAPFVACVLARGAAQWVAKTAAVLLLVAGIPWLLLCVERPVLGKETVLNTSRDALFFKTPHQKYQASFEAGRQFLASQKVTGVGLLISNSSWEYVWWHYLQKDHPGVRIEHVNVQDPSARFAASARFSGFSPDALVTLDQKPQPEQITVGAATFTCRWKQEKVAIYLRD